MAIQFRSASTPVNDATTPATITKPAGVVSGDMLLLHVGINLDETPTPPSGFTLIVGTTQTGLYNIRTYAKIAGGSEPATYDVPFTGGGTCGLGMVAWYSDNAHTLAVDVAASQNNTGTTREWPTVTAAQAGEALTCFGTVGVNAASTPDAAMTERYDAESAVRMYCMTQVLVAAGATGTRTATTAGSGTSRCASVLVLEVLVPPTAPSLLTATAISPYRIDLEWQDNSATETGFEIDHSLNGSSWSLLATTAAGVETYSHTGLTPAILHYYRVRAINADGGSAYTSTASATTFYSPPALMRLYLLQPTVIFTARINQPVAATYPLNELTWDGLVEGAFADIRHGMTLTLGSTQYNDDYGRQRIRGDTTSSLLRVGRSSKGTRDGELSVIDNAYISVYDDHRVWAKIMYIADDGEIFKDAEIDYSDQTLEPPPVAIAGPGFAATIDGDGVITVAFDGSDSYTTADGATITDYGWDLKDGTVIAGSVTTATVTATFPAGFRWINLTVEDSNGSLMTSHRPIYARDPADDGQPGGAITHFQIDQHRVTSAGQQLAIRIRQEIDAGDYPDGTLVMLWESEPTSPADRSHMVFQGWHQTDPCTIGAERTGILQDVTLQCLDVAGRLDTLPGFAQTIERDATPTAWSQMADLNFDRFMHYLLHWDSTALEVADWFWSGTGDDYEYFRVIADGDSLYDQVERQAMKLCPDHHFTCNTLGQLFVNPDPLLQDTGDRTATIQATLTKSDWSDLRYTSQRPPRIRQLWGEALQADPTEAIPLFCVAPGLSPSQGEQESRHSEQLCTGQSSLNATTGHRYARLNAPQGLFSITLAEGDDLDIEPADMTWVRLTISAATAAQRGLAFTNARGLVKELNIRYAHERTGLVRTVDLTWERETSGSAAVTYTPPAAEPVDDGDDWTPPPIVEDVTPPAPVSTVQVVGMLDSLGNIFTTSNFQSSPPTWAINISLATHFPASNEILSFVVDPFSPGYRGTGTAINGYVATEDGIWKLTDLFGTPTATELFTFAETAVGSLGQWRTIAASFGRFEAVETDNPWIMVASHYNNNLFLTNKGTTIVYSQDAGQTWSSEITVTVAYDPNYANNDVIRYPAIWLSPRTPGYARVCAYDTDASSLNRTSTYATDDWGATWTEETNAVDGTGNPYISPGDMLGGCLHVPWPDNEDELIVYHGRVIHGSTSILYGTRRTTGIPDLASGAVDISPEPGAGQYGPQRGLFAIRTYDNDRRYVVMVGHKNEASSGDEVDDEAAVFYSTDYGATWDLFYGPFTCATNDRFPVEAAFSSDNPGVIFIWESERAVSFTDDAGASVEDKSGNLAALGGSIVEFRGFFGGPT